MTYPDNGRADAAGMAADEHGGRCALEANAQRARRDGATGPGHYPRTWLMRTSHQAAAATSGRNLLDTNQQNRENVSTLRNR